MDEEGQFANKSSAAVDRRRFFDSLDRYPINHFTCEIEALPRHGVGCGLFQRDGLLEVADLAISKLNE